MNDVLMVALIGIMLYLLFGWFRERERNRMRRALIDKFGTAQDLGSFLQSPGGERFMRDLSEGRHASARSIIGTIQGGVLALLLGAACFPAGGGFSSDKAHATATAVGMLLIFLGVGLLICAAISYWLSRHWGLMERRRED